MKITAGYAKLIIWFWLLGMLCFSGELLLAQDSSAVKPADLLKQLARAYEQFDYARSAELLNIAFRSLDNFPPADKIEIYRYAAFIAFQQGNSTLASNHFWNLLEIDPTYSLDPVETPPKLLTLFQKTKIEYLEDLNRRIRVLQERAVHKPVPWRSFLFPGWEQWHRGYRTRGALLGAAGVISLGGFIYSVVQTGQKKSAYESATDPARAAELYQQYNRFYRNQFYFGYAFFATWAFSQVDLTLWSHPKIRMKLTTGVPRLYQKQLFLSLQASF